MSDRIEQLISRMTLEEKVSLLAGADLWHTVPIPRLGIPAIRVTDGPIGARGSRSPYGPKSACFPCGSALAATWNIDLVRRVGKALAEETRAKGAHILLAPTVNIHRSPLAGRNFECYSEDPYLTARMAIAYIDGLQSEGVGACIKHFVCNDSEYERTSMSSEVSERALREIYLRPFQLAVREARPWAVMSSYNRVNGTYAGENDILLLDILKGEWAFDGIVMSDWWGTYSDGVAGSGLDLEMPGPARWMGDHALEAIRDGRLSQAGLDDKARRLLRVMERVGAFEQPELQPEQAIDKPEHRLLAREAAAEAIVLLKNDDAILPLDVDRIGSVAVIGANARRTAFRGGGSVRVDPHYLVSPLDAFRSRVGDKVDYAVGCAIHKLPPVFDATWLTGDLAVDIFANRDLAGEPVRTTTADGLELFWNKDKLAGVEMDNFSARLIGAFTVPESGTYEFGTRSAGPSRVIIDDNPIFDFWDTEPGEHGRSGIRSIELTAGRTYAIKIEYAAKPASNWQHLIVGCIPQIPDDSIQQAVDLAARSDVAIVFVGLTDEWESEGFDRPDMELPGAQAELIERVAAANPNTIVVINAGSPVTMPWLDEVAAVAQAWYLGQETGHAIVDVLSGDINPSGKLPTTFPKRLQDNPAYLNYPGENGKVLYGEGLFVGYRYYDKKDIEPLFPFGYGLSYTTFTYSNLALIEGENGRIDVLIDVRNTGNRAGQEIVQLYVHDVQSRLARPDKELKAFAKVAIEPGESKTVTLTLDRESLSYYDPAENRWVVDDGEFDVLVGGSSQDVPLVARFAVVGEQIRLDI
ncbi:MAG: glycoside hydrolase family 3 C-terminal domain-containing protein [Anaerolineae bacterium]|nr:glycoside hydrolase family 3 C-terminal domain-containing protein [Anaerolineae bacterium]